MNEMLERLRVGGQQLVLVLPPLVGAALILLAGYFLARQVQRRGRQVLLMVPEIALTPSVTALFRGAFGSRVAIQHSALSDGERHDQWHRIRRGDVDLVERAVQRGAAVPARAEHHLLRDVVGVGLEVEVGRDEVGDVHQVLGAGGLSGSLVGGHGPILVGPATVVDGGGRESRAPAVDSGRVGPSEW